MHPRLLPRLDIFSYHFLISGDIIYEVNETMIDQDETYDPPSRSYDVIDILYYVPKVMKIKRSIIFYYITCKGDNISEIYKQLIRFVS